MTANPYDLGYWERYRHYDQTVMGATLTGLRLAFVNRYWPGVLVDIGIGGGRFVEARPITLGYDVNPHAVAWLTREGWWFDPYAHDCSAASFWDSLEHIADPGPLLAHVRRFAFVSAPIYSGLAHVLRSKHFRPDEHCWYWTASGLSIFMAHFGFREIARNTMEQEAGREDIMTFAFERT